MSKKIIKNCIKTIFIVPLFIGSKNIEYTISYQRFRMIK